MATTEFIPLFLSCARGLEPLLVQEASSLGATEAREQNGGVACTATWPVAYRICLWSRLASRVLLPLTQFEAVDAEQLYNAARQIDWPGWFSANRSFAVEVAGRSATLTHTHFAALKVKDAIATITAGGRMWMRPIRTFRCICTLMVQISH